MQDLPDTIPPETLVFVERIGHGTDRARKIIDELLLLASMGREEVAVTAVHTADILPLAPRPLAPND